MIRALRSLSSDGRDAVRAEDLNVAPALLGAPLARPGRRLLAIALDVSVVALLSNLGNLWLVGGLALIGLLLLRSLPWAERTRARRWLLIGLGAALLAVGAQQAWVTGEFIAPPQISKDEDLPESIPGLTPEQDAQARIALLQTQLDAARHRSVSVREQVSEWIDEVGLGLGWAIVYFTLLPVGWNGQTLGKRLLRLRAVELTGKPMTVLRAFKRYGGYAAGMATGGFGFAQVLWDPNRQAIQDKTAHTVVIDLRRKLERTEPPTVHAEEPR